METWAFIWKLVFIIVMAVFAGMSVWVTIGGWQDIKKLLAKLNEAGGNKPPVAPPRDPDDN